MTYRTYRDEWFGDSNEDDDDQQEQDDEPKRRTRHIPRWQCYEDVDKSGSKWTRETFRVEYTGGGNRGKCITHDCECGGVGHHTSRNICVHRYRIEWLRNHYESDEYPDEYGVEFNDR